MFEQVETLRPTLHAVDSPERVVDCGAHVVALLDQIRQASLDDLLLAPTLSKGGGVGLCARRQVAERRDDAFEFEQVRL